MDAKVNDRPMYQAKPLSELISSITCLLSDNDINLLKAKQQERKTMAVSRSVGKFVKPFTRDEMTQACHDIAASRKLSPRRQMQSKSTSKKRTWNSSVKVECKTKSVTANGQMKNTNVRKKLNFQPKVTYSRKTVLNPETPTFAKPAPKIKKPLDFMARINVAHNDTSGIHKLSETPMLNHGVKRMTIFNKENVKFSLNSMNKKAETSLTPYLTKKPTTPKSILKRTLKQPIFDDVSQVNSSIKSDESFLQKEKEANEIEEIPQATNENLNRISVLAPLALVSPSLENYRNVNDYFNSSDNTSVMADDSTLYIDSTILSFEIMPNFNENNNKEQCDVSNLCHLLTKANINMLESKNTELEQLLKIEKQLENGRKLLTSITESQMEALNSVRKLIQNHKSRDVCEIQNMETQNKCTESPKTSQRCSVIKSPSYKIPKKSVNLSRKVLHASSPKVSDINKTPVKGMDTKVLSMYMKMKKKMNFLNTPSMDRHREIQPDTPTVTSHNLQKQLASLYDESD
ncbi:uncharacterized protein LOC126975135 isoform X2 [Leptidea sinapis]|uniref:uncharacterized protein LOC126975135 isoform X2 n=1 Tax=Leptidea sinapis TaxID=189913 RepID=UPI0021C377C1|nr:uncharacterized protein LOC126975135 isoform X2 [Leptidea sinapis]